MHPVLRAYLEAPDRHQPDRGTEVLLSSRLQKAVSLCSLSSVDDPFNSLRVSRDHLTAIIGVNRSRKQGSKPISDRACGNIVMQLLLSDAHTYAMQKRLKNDQLIAVTDSD
jgi:hypothetical protein